MVFDFRLKVFYTVAHKLSFTKAASELFITQPAVTKHIRELEQQLGMALFKRNGNSISITAGGEILLKYAEKIFDTYKLLENELAQLNKITGGTIRIGASTTLAQTLVPKMLGQFKKTYPVFQLSFIRGNTDFISKQLIEEKIDLAIVEGASHYPQISYENFMKDEIVLVAKTNSKLAKLMEITPEQLLNIPLVLRESGSGTLDIIFKAMAETGISTKELSIDIQMESNISIKQYLQYSDSAAFLSIQSIVNELKRNELSIIDIKDLEIFRTFQFIQLHGKNSKLADLFKRFCKTNSDI
ncbi:MAG TPA: LysR substrate-binding domain-containing protein [Flavisolibacter sp.]|nr:LysR substrate-binding domain-containing protein [Flavisolibacter sp.]